MSKPDKNFVFEIDDTTWNDLTMDRVYDQLCVSRSSVGKDYTRAALHRLIFDEELLKLRGKRSEYLSCHEDTAAFFQKVFKCLGVTKKYSFIEYIFRIREVSVKGNAIHFLLAFLLLAAIAALFISPVAGVIGIIVMFAVNISTYFSCKNKVEAYFVCIKYLAGMVVAADKIGGANLSGTPFEDICRDIKRLAGIFARIRRGSWLITNSVSGSLVDVIMDYIRMLFHVDLIKFNNMLKTALSHQGEIRQLYEDLGEIELAININHFRSSGMAWCTPEFTECVPECRYVNMNHPLVRKPVPNTLLLAESPDVLLTGSNASGKSTFLKTLAINQIFAQTIYTCLAEEYKTVFCKVISSMAINDNILGNESYFIVEIKSVKRIFDELGDITVMCFVDEILRGTNTKERIAAGKVLLERLAASDTILLAATHDIELTRLLDGVMRNCHFSETVSDGEVSFDYKLKEGPSCTMNALLLLKSYGFDKAMIEEAQEMVNNHA